MNQILAIYKLKTSCSAKENESLASWLALRSAAGTLSIHSLYCFWLYFVINLLIFPYLMLFTLNLLFSFSNRPSLRTFFECPNYEADSCENCQISEPAPEGPYSFTTANSSHCKDKKGHKENK